MAAKRDHSDVTAENNTDGSFKRAPSSFRGKIEKGGEFEPEKGKSLRTILGNGDPEALAYRQIPPLRRL